jgi:hypothetical protein
MEKPEIHTIDQLAEIFQFKKEDVLNIYLYGSRVYKTHEPMSDHDYIIVFKSAFLPSRAFKDNAVSNEDRSVQMIAYSRTGFKAALEQYEIASIEMMYLSKEMVVQKKWNYKIDNINIKEFAKKIITKCSNSWHHASLALSDNNYCGAKKGFYHSIRIADFAQQLKDSNFEKLDFSNAILYWNEIKSLSENDEGVEMKRYLRDKLLPFRDSFFESLRK